MRSQFPVCIDFRPYKNETIRKTNVNLRYNAPVYRAPLPAPVPVKKTITIYEDPRVDVGRRDYAEPQYADDYVQLDVKHAPAYYDYRSYDQKPYDDYYY